VGESNPLQDFPLRAETILEPPSPIAAPASKSSPEGQAAAPIPTRLTAAAADGALLLLLTALAILGARVASGRAPSPAGLAWAAGFLVYLSFFATVPPLVLFGRTVGMALADLTAGSGEDGSNRIGGLQAARRWIGTLATAASLGLLLFATARRPDAPTPADRVSGHPLQLD
jgi:hypothetical protein